MFCIWVRRFVAIHRKYSSVARSGGELQPSYARIDLISNIKETNNVVWIAREKRLGDPELSEAEVISVILRTADIESDIE